jgi:Fibronectin type III domain.
MVLMMSPQIVLATVPDAPDNLDAYAVSSSEIDLEWDEVDDADGYYIYSSTSSSGSYSKVGTSSTPYYTCTGLMADKNLLF